MESKPAKARRKPSSAQDQVKHRRTRSGCYTCRSRRVKCGEERPICERCRKGSRECTYPKVLTTKSSLSKLKSDLNATAEASEGDDIEEEEEYEDEESEAFHPASTSSFEESTGVSVDLRPPLSSIRTSSGVPSLILDQSRTPSTEGSFGLAAYAGGMMRNPGQKQWNPAEYPEPSQKTVAGTWGKSGWSKYSPEIQFYLHYHETHMTYHYYSLKTNCDIFLKTTFLDIAVRNEPLLYAVVGFAAYHHTITKPDGQLQDFMKFYNKSLSLLVGSLRSRRNTEATILTILQLATMEEYLGHWVNLRNHQEAAYKILVQLYTPETIMNNEISRLILAWYARFDVFSGLLSGKPTTLSRVWFEASLQHYLRRIAMDPDDLIARMEALFSDIRLFSMDLADLIDRAPRIPRETFLHENAIMTHRIAAWGTNIDSRLVDPAFAVRLPGYRQASDVIDPYEPGLLLHSHLWPVNTALIDWYAIDAMHRFQASKVLGQPIPVDIGPLAIKMCQMFEAMERWPNSPAGCLVASQASLSFSSLFLPQEQRYIDWARQKLAVIERSGYIYSPAFHKRLSDLWRDPSILTFWTPNPTPAQFPPIIRSIRTFVQDRQINDDTAENESPSSSSGAAAGGGNPSLQTSSLAPLPSSMQEHGSGNTSPTVENENSRRERDLREMKTIFSAMALEPPVAEGSSVGGAGAASGDGAAGEYYE